MDAVSKGTHDGHTDIVHDNRRHAAEINPEITQSMGHYRIRCTHPHKKMRCKKKACGRADDGGNQTHQKVGMNSFGDIFFILGTEVAGDDDAAAGGNACKKTDNQKNNCSGGTNCSKGIIVGKIADNLGIHHIIKLLKQLPEKQRNGKSQNTAGD